MEKRLKVVYLDHCADLSGGEIALARLLAALEQVDAHVILAEDGPLRPLLESQGVAVEVMALDEATRKTTRNQVARAGSLARALSTLRYSFRISRRLRRLKPDLVHTNSLKSAVYGAIAARLAGVPAICHLRDRLATDYMSAGGARMMRLVLRFLPRAVIANSVSTVRTLTPSTTALRVFGAVTYDPVPPQAADSRARNGELLVGMVGRLSEWKGQHVFIDAFSRAFPDGPERALIVGSAMFGEDAYEARVREQVRDLGMEGRIEFAGFSGDIPGLLRQLDILVHASVIPEPFGQVVVEGMAAGLTVIASDAGGPSEIISSGVNGVLCPPGDVDALAAALKDLGGAPDRRRAIGLAARVKAAEFRPERAAEQVMAVYSVIANRPRGSKP